jgi:hypothetical protein
VIDGRKVSTDIKTEIGQKVAVRKQQGKKIPHLAIILVGDDGASQTYVDNKVKACKSVGFHYTMMRFADTISEEKLMKHIDHVNDDEDDLSDPDQTEFVGSFVSLHHGHNRKASTNFKVGISKVLENLEVDGDDDLVVTLVPKIGKGEIVIGKIMIEFLPKY